MEKYYKKIINKAKQLLVKKYNGEYDFLEQFYKKDWEKQLFTADDMVSFATEYFIKNLKPDYKGETMIFDGGVETNVIKGMLKYGAYKVPYDINKYRILLIRPIYNPTVTLILSDLKKGREPIFPGLKELIRMPVNIDKKNIITYRTLNDAYKQLKEQLKKEHYERIIALCFVDFNVFDNGNILVKKNNQYIKIRNLLSERGIESILIRNDLYHDSKYPFKLFELALDILKKIDGIPYVTKNNQNV